MNLQKHILPSVGVIALTFAIAGCNATAPVSTTNAVTNKAANTAVVTNSTNTMTTTNTAAMNSNSAVNSNSATNTSTSSTSTTSGDTLKIDEAGIMMTVPKGFKFSKDGEDTIVKSEDEGVDIRFTVPKDGDYETTVTNAAKDIDSYLDDVKVTDKGSKVNVNGMEGTSMDGTAKVEGEAVNWNLTILKAPKKPVLVNIYAEKTSLDKYAPQVKAFLDSVKKQ